MSYVAKDKDVDAPVAASLHKIRITLSSKNVKSLEKGKIKHSLALSVVQ